MKKRKITNINDTDKKRPKIVFEDCPPISCLKDLIELGKKGIFFKNINNISLWNVLEQLEELHSMVGIDKVKETVFYQVVYYLQNMHEKNQNEEYLHTIITGKPGCGKTKLAKIIGSIYTNLDILSYDSKFYTATRDDFIGQYLGSTTAKTKKLLDKSIGNVLFIDEVYSLGTKRNDHDSYSKEAIDALCGFLSENKNNTCVIIAGYKKEIKECFLSVNPGLERRFPWVHEIDDYTFENLADIFLLLFKKTNWILDNNINNTYLNNFFKENINMFTHFGGDIEIFISKIKMIHAKRVFNLDISFKFIISTDDFEDAFILYKKSKNINQKQNLYNFYT
jgi:SpoVK/Ycf46/Vps4 family AAA+-type ATPase